MTELWNAYTENGIIIPNVILEKHKPIPKGMFHLVSDIIVKHHDGSILLTQRDKNKKFGGLWEASAGGAAQQGESAEACAIRELREETGIITNQLEFLCYCVKKEVQSIFAEFQLITDMPKTNVILQKNETIDYRWVYPDELRNMKNNGQLTKRMQNYLNQYLH